MIDKSHFDILTYINTRYASSTGIVYCMTKAECEVMADYLRDNGVRSYHNNVISVIIFNLFRSRLLTIMLDKRNSKEKRCNQLGYKKRSKLFVQPLPMVIVYFFLDAHISCLS